MLSPAYVAGLFDGEGTVSLIYTIRRRKVQSDIPILGFKFAIKLASTYRPVLDQLREQYRGYINVSKHRNAVLRHKPVFAWTISGAEDQRRFLEDIADHVVIKKQQVAVGLRYVKTVGVPGARVFQRDWELRVECHRELEALNQRGNKPPPKHSIPSSPPTGWSPRQRYSPEELEKFMARMRAARRG